MPIVIEYYSPSCGYCKKFEPIFKRLQSYFFPIVDFIAVDCSSFLYSDYCTKKAIKGVPTINFYYPSLRSKVMIKKDISHGMDYNSIVEYIKSSLPNHLINFKCTSNTCISEFKRVKSV